MKLPTALPKTRPRLPPPPRPERAKIDTGKIRLTTSTQMSAFATIEL